MSPNSTPPTGLRFPPMAYTTLAISILDGNMDDAAVALLCVGADQLAREEKLPHVQAPAHAEARRTARKHQRL